MADIQALLAPAIEAASPKRKKELQRAAAEHETLVQLNVETRHEAQVPVEEPEE